MSQATRTALRVEILGLQRETAELQEQIKALTQPISSDEAIAILGEDRLPGDATFRIAACGFFVAAIKARVK